LSLKGEHMADVALYFDDSGFGGTAGSEDGWAAVANWQAGLGDGDYPTLSHLIENGWEDDLPGLEEDIQSALKDDSSALGAGKASLEEFLSVLQDRADGDKAVAITLNEETEDSPTADEPLPADNAKGGKGMPSAGADVSPQKSCRILKDGGVHDASGKWRPLTQAQRGMFGALCGQAKGKKPTTHEEVQELVEVVDGTPLDESLTVEDIVAMYDASPQAPNQTNEEHILALASVAERINGAVRHPDTGQFTSPEPIKESKPRSPPHLGEHSSTAYEATKKIKPGKGPASDSISYSTAAYGYAVAGDHVSAAKAHRKAATAHNKAYSNLREDNTERALHKAAENLHRAAARSHALLAGGPAANGEFTDTWADESDPLYGLTPEEVRDSLAELCGRQVTESVRESAILF
jgi:hypothetical protein